MQLAKRCPTGYREDAIEGCALLNVGDLLTNYPRASKSKSTSPCYDGENWDALLNACVAINVGGDRSRPCANGQRWDDLLQICATVDVGSDHGYSDHGCGSNRYWDAVISACVDISLGGDSHSSDHHRNNEHHKEKDNKKHHKAPHFDKDPCPHGWRFDSTALICISIGDGIHVDAKLHGRNACGDGQSWNTLLGICVGLDLGGSHSNNCADGKRWDSVLSACVDISLGGNDEPCGCEDDEKPKKKHHCPKGKYYNGSTKRCEVSHHKSSSSEECPDGQRWDATISLCVDINIGNGINIGAGLNIGGSPDHSDSSDDEGRRKHKSHHDGNNKQGKKCSDNQYLNALNICVDAHVGDAINAHGEAHAL